MVLDIGRDQVIDYLTGRVFPEARPRNVGVKYAPDGGRMPFAGNTILCRVDPNSDAGRAIGAAQQRLRQGPVAGAFAFLPLSSLHMTVFEGVTERVRDQPNWPEGVARDTPLPAVTEELLKRLMNMPPLPAAPVRLTDLFGGLTLRLTGATGTAEADLRAARDTLRDRLAMHRPDHATYVFHITLAYLLRWLTPEEARSVADLSAEIETGLQAPLSAFSLLPPEFCTFGHMEAFDTVRPLGQSGSIPGN